MRTRDNKYYDEEGVQAEIVEEDVILSLDEEPPKDMASGEWRRKLQNVMTKINPLYYTSINKIMTKKSIPSQILVRWWVAEKV